MARKAPVPDQGRSTKLEPMPAFMSGKIQVKGNPLFIAQLVGILQNLKA